MNVSINETQARELDAQRREFNRFTGGRLTLEQYAAFILADAIKANGGAARIARGLFRGAPVHAH